jgi:hypothetical protein
MRGAILPLPNTPSWRGARLKHMDNFTFTLFRLENLKERDHFEDLGTDGKIILEWILEK